MRRLCVTAGRRCVGSVFLVFVFLVAVPSWASAPLQGILACRRITDGTARLACFDRESASIQNFARAPVAASSAPRATPARAVAEDDQPARTASPALSSSLDPRRTFGMPPEKLLEQEEAAQRVPRPLDHITAHVQSLSQAADGREIFTLDNREVWAQLVPEDLYVKPGDAVKISRAMLGSYWLALQSRRGGCKVTRLQ
jgi:hypothetical protein